MERTESAGYSLFSKATPRTGAVQKLQKLVELEGSGPSGGSNRPTRFLFRPATEVLDIPAPEGEPSFGHLQFYVKVKDIPKNLPKDPNPRDQNVSTKVAKSIQASARDPEQKLFRVANRGLLLVAKSFKRMDNNKTIRLNMPLVNEDGVEYGLADGATSYEILMRLLQNQRDPDAARIVGEKYVLVEVIVGLKKDDIDYVVSSRNTSVQLKESSLRDHAGDYDFIKHALAPKGWDEGLIFRMNQPTGSVEIKDLVDMLIMINPLVGAYDQGGKVPRPCHGTNLYGQTSGTPMFTKHHESMVKMAGIVPQIIETHDWIMANLADLYNNGYKGKVKAGNMILFRQTSPYERSKSSTAKEQFTPFLKLPVKHYPVKPLLLGIMGSLRCMVVEKNGKIVWAVPYKEVRARLERVAHKMVAKARDFAQKDATDFARNQPAYWESMYMTLKHGE